MKENTNELLIVQLEIKIGSLQEDCAFETFT